MSEEETSKFKPGDLVKPSRLAFRYGLRFRVRNWPWRIVKVEGNLVTVTRKSHATGREYRSTYHEDFLEKVEEEA